MPPPIFNSRCFFFILNEKFDPIFSFIFLFRFSKKGYFLCIKLNILIKYTKSGIYFHIILRNNSLFLNMKKKNLNYVLRTFYQFLENFVSFV